MRYEKAEIVHRIALDMHGLTEGLTIEDIRTRYTDRPLSRRTAERLRDAVERLYPMENANSGELPKRWRIRGDARTLTAVTANDLADLDTAVAVLRRDNLLEHARNLERLASKVRALVKPTEMARIAPDLEALTESEGLAFRPGPRPKIEPAIVAELRHAVIACRKVRLHYRARGTGMLSRQIVCPYGFLYGSRHYLVAYSLNTKVRDYRLYSLAEIEQIDALPYSFERAKDFSLPNFVKQSFGIFREEPFEVVWRFSPLVAGEAVNFLFHPDQTMEPQRDGSLLVSFKAGGALEMAWHLYTWGKHVKVIKPKRFWARIEARRDSLSP